MKRINWLYASLLAFAVGCGGAPVKVEAPKVVKPDWIMKGNGAFPGDAGTVIYGVGVVSMDPNPALTRKAADNRARQEVAETMKTEVASMMKDFMESHKDYFQPDAAGSDELISAVSKSVSQAVLINCKIVDRFEDAEANTFYALARIDMNSNVYDQYKENVKKAIREQHRAVVKERADEALGSLDAEIEKQRSREKEILGVK